MKSILLLICGLICAVSSETCKNPQISSTQFTTIYPSILTHVAYIAVFEVKCDGNNVVRNLYSEVKGNISPVSIVDNNKFQVSWTDEKGQASKGDNIVRIYQEEEVSALRKAQRSGEDISTVPSLGSIVINYPGVQPEFFIFGEYITVLAAVFATYYALASKYKIDNGY